MACKLSEPVPQNSQGRTTLAWLRALEPRFGRAWRYVPPPHSETVLEAPSEVASDTESEMSGPRILHFAIAKPGYWLERIAVTVVLPATVDEVVDAVQAEREETCFQFFPYLLAVQPQPCQGSGFLLACPMWKPDAVFVCLDTSLIDGRIFAAPCPAYVTKHQLLVLADIPERLDLRVHVAEDMQPLDEEVQVHIAAGVRVAFVPNPDVHSYAPSLGQALLNPDYWSSRDTVPYPGQWDAYCLVGRRETVLCMQASGSPLTYRHNIARCVGVQEPRLRLFPSKPRIHDAAVNGLPCSTVIAFEEVQRAGSWRRCAVIFDARPILQGWRMLYASPTDIAHTCLADLFGNAPTGWQVSVMRANAQLSAQPLRSGHVLVVFYAKGGHITASAEGEPGPSASMPSASSQGPAEQGHAAIEQRFTQQPLGSR